MCVVCVGASARVTEMLMWDEGGVVAVSAEHEYVGGTRGSGIVSITADVLGMSGALDERSWWSM